MERESRISYEDVKGLVEAMSEVTERLVPGMSLFYRECLLRRGSWDSFDSKELAVVKTCPDGDAVPVRGAIVEIGYEPFGRKKLLRRLAGGVVRRGDVAAPRGGRGRRLRGRLPQVRGVRPAEGGRAVTEPGEERRGDLLRKLARNCGWHARVWTLEKDGFVRKQVSSENWFLIWDGKTWTDVWRKLLMDLNYVRRGPLVPSDPPVQWFRDALPAWVVGCGSEEELVLMAEVLP